jgi:uncharacterized membrane protein YfcA
LTLADLSWKVLVVLGLVAVLGAFVQAVVGLGMGLVAAPVVGLLEPSLVPSLPLWLALCISGLMLVGERAHIDWRALAWALPSRVPGTVVGAWLVVAFSEEQIGIAVALMTLVAVTVAVRAARIPVTPATLVGAGFGAGVTGTATSIGGPAIALLFQREPPAVMRSTLSVFFFVGVLLSLAGLGISGSLGRESGEVALVLAPGVVAGMLVGRAVRDRIHRDAFRAAVLMVCTASAVTLLVRSLL